MTEKHSTMIRLPGTLAPTTTTTTTTTTTGPDAYRTWRESLIKDVSSVMTLVHPLVKKDPYYAPTALHHFQLTLQEIDRLNNERQVIYLLLLLLLLLLLHRPFVNSNDDVSASLGLIGY